MNIKSLFKLYTIPVLVLFFGFGLYWTIFVYTSEQKEDFITESFNPDAAVLSQPEMNYKEEEKKLEQSSVRDSLDSNKNFSADEESNQDKKILNKNTDDSYQSSSSGVSRDVRTPQTLEHPGLYVALGKTLNIRKSPDIASEIIGKLNYNQEIEVESIQNNWAKLKNGWVYARLLKPIESKIQPIKSVDENFVSGVYKSLKVVNIRLEPTTSSKVVGKLFPDQTVKVRDIQNGWGKIQDGWVLLDLLSKQSDDSSL